MHSNAFDVACLTLPSDAHFLEADLCNEPRCTQLRFLAVVAPSAFSPAPARRRDVRLRELDQLAQ